MERITNADTINLGINSINKNLEIGDVTESVKDFQHLAGFYTLDSDQLTNLRQQIPSSQRFNLWERVLYDTDQTVSMHEHEHSVDSTIELRTQIGVAYLSGMLEKPKTFELYREFAKKIGVDLTPESVKLSHQEFINLLYPEPPAAEPEKPQPESDQPTPNRPRVRLAPGQTPMGPPQPVPPPVAIPREPAAPAEPVRDATVKVVEITDIRRDVMQQIGEILESPADDVIVELAPEMARQYLLQLPLPERVKEIKSSSVELVEDKKKGPTLKAKVVVVTPTPIGGNIDVTFEGAVVNNSNGAIFNNPHGGISTEVKQHGIPPLTGGDVKDSIKKFNQDPNGVIKENVDDQLMERFYKSKREFSGIQITADRVQLAFRRMTNQEFRAAEEKWLIKTAHKLAEKEDISEQEAADRIMSARK